MPSSEFVAACFIVRWKLDGEPPAAGSRERGEHAKSYRNKTNARAKRVTQRVTDRCEATATIPTSSRCRNIQSTAESFVSGDSGNCIADSYIAVGRSASRESTRNLYFIDDRIFFDFRFAIDWRRETSIPQRSGIRREMSSSVDIVGSRMLNILERCTSWSSSYFFWRSFHSFSKIRLLDQELRRRLQTCFSILSKTASTFQRCLKRSPLPGKCDWLGRSIIARYLSLTKIHHIEVNYGFHYSVS